MKWMRGNSQRREELKPRRKRRKSVKAKNSRIIVFTRLLTYLLLFGEYVYYKCRKESTVSTEGFAT